MASPKPPVILGAGPAGAAAAIRLAQIGAKPVLIDRLAVPGDALCGGFMSWATLAQVEALGVSATGLGGHRVTRLALFAGGHETCLPLPAPAMGLSRHRLDTALRQAALEAGVDLRIGA
ncbi:MAG: FAD-dependent monooxygenase, partial [bacterium]|nr:FAD-dependent monooxygenase [bacterium]